MKPNPQVQWVLPCKNLSVTLEFYTSKLGFRLDAIFPADAPWGAHISGHGTRIRLEQSDDPAPRSLRWLGEWPHSLNATASLVSPDGTLIERIIRETTLQLPPMSAGFVLHKKADDAWGEGRAGMQYRDLVPGRLGGALIASHIRIPQGGPVADYVHHHGVLFQVIYCARGWVKVVYQDQGPEFVLHEGDCVLQPPGIRHQVLESSDGLEVIEIGSPAEHMTFVDHEMILPTDEPKPGRQFGGQRFVRHQAETAEWLSGIEPGFDVRDIGLTAATNGVISLHVLRANETGTIESQCREGLQFFFVLQGSAELQLGSRSNELAKDDAFVIPGAMDYGIKSISNDLQLLRLTLHRYSY